MLYELLKDINKKGVFKLKSGRVSNNYFNLRELFSQPKKLDQLTSLIFKELNIINRDVRICPVPIGAIPLATLLAVKNNIGLIIPRPEKKTYGMKNTIDGRFNKNDYIIVIEDVITSGFSINEILEVLKKEDLSFEVFVVFDRQAKKDFSFPYRSLYTRTQFMKDKLKTIAKEKGNKYSDNINYRKEIAIFVVNRDYNDNEYWKIMQYSKYDNFLVLSTYLYQEEKYDLYYAKLGDNLADKNSLILQVKEQIEAGVNHVGYFEEGQIVVDEIIFDKN